MSIQEIAISNNQKKHLLKAVQDESILFQDDNGDLVVNVAAYEASRTDKNPTPIEDIIGEDVLDYNAEYFVFS